MMFMQLINWNAVTGQSSDLREITACTIDTLKLVVDKHAPMKQASRNKQRLKLQKPWNGSLNLLKLNMLCTKLIFYLMTQSKFMNLKNIQID